MSKQRQNGSNLNKRKLSKMTKNPIENPEIKQNSTRNHLQHYLEPISPIWSSQNPHFGPRPLTVNTPSMWPAFTAPRFWSPWLAATFASASFTAAWDSGVTGGGQFRASWGLPQILPLDFATICHDVCLPNGGGNTNGNWPWVKQDPRFRYSVEKTQLGD